MAGIKYTAFYLSQLKLACILLKIEVYNAGPSTRGRDPLSQFFSAKSSFCSFFARRCTIISDLDFDFERVLKLQQLLYFHSRTQAICKSSETLDNMKLDSSSDTDSSIENTYSSSEENSNIRYFIVGR